MVLSFFLIQKSLTPSSRSIQSSNPFCREYATSCRSNSDCCSFNCKSNICQKKILTKGLIGEYCDYDSDCICNNCIDKICIANINGSCKGATGQYCRTDQECASANCLNSICVGNSWVGQYCLFDQHCRSNICDPNWNVCLGSEQDPGRYNEPCRYDLNCLSNNCRSNVCR